MRTFDKNLEKIFFRKFALVPPYGQKSKNFKSLEFLKKWHIPPKFYAKIKSDSRFEISFSLKNVNFYLYLNKKICIFKVERNFKSRIGLDFRDFRIKLRGYMSFFEKFETFEIFRFLTIRGDQAKKIETFFFPN